MLDKIWPKITASLSLARLRSWRCYEKFLTSLTSLDMESRQWSGRLPDHQPSTGSDP